MARDVVQLRSPAARVHLERFGATRGGNLSRRDILKAAGAAFGLAAVGCATAGDDPEGSLYGGGKADGLTDTKLLAGIDTIVVLCMENRSFDHYFGSRLLEEGSRIDGLTGDESNPAPDGSRVPVFRMDQFTTQDINHSWDACTRNGTPEPTTASCANTPGRTSAIRWAITFANNYRPRISSPMRSRSAIDGSRR